ncbi:unnamed protein product [Merluccius merluccius]
MKGHGTTGMKVVSQTTSMALNNASVSSNPNYTMTTNSYSGNSTNTTTVTGGAAGSLQAGLSCLLPSIIAAASFLHRFC